MAAETRRVVIAGAGPVGMVCALALNRCGVPVTVFESEAAPVPDQRAATIHPSTLEMLDELGVTEQIREHSLLSSTYRFHDRPTGEVVAEFDLGRLKDEIRFPYVLQYEQYKLTAAIAAAYANESDFDVRFSHTLTGLTDTASGIEVEYTSPAGPERIAAAYVVGCDGGRSTVRKLAGIEFEGFTYPERFIKIATSFDLQTIKPELSYRNYFSDPNEWANVFKVRGEAPEGLWRVILPIGPEEDDTTALSPARVEQRLQKFLPQDGEYHVEYRNVYGVNQRVAATFRRGRILLAGDSAHVNNPIGGMGMNGGIHDAINLTEKLAKVLAGASADLLDLYSRQRRHAAVNYVQAQTIANKRLLEERDPEVRRRNFDQLRRTAEKFETARAYMRRAALFDSLQDAAAIT
ncbi:FAD-binding monooxygenase [Kribbella sandramycini]|uniref:3-(3-hydroxy-phenyl)propionate hydroxylase n=1 Tax=Kribbella sandramycini TaxID=60450 RepID=A0A7Y4L565_9ACTN|nr:FAD-dependent monooxygenase [Kribbella sandramycini]MBB6571212.1 3-(3-hydroxy-phenyl)propionate hydroxylase [Kribbella sandramycini]NOL43381.1 FAD-binding monooxygenase [Kribbella sandramycini]